ncbi:Metallo-dependent hydrolase [Teratosphaeria nubilosa]|uniref:adenosine deaminase n=1 Tax=Teratosphaeria nubilosa TaxID=161662 RepID=A0A6G1L2F1_9PEZI|nr:Metallo-dependent hydrolase [Teratosphaeria nubilosa]
MDSPKDDIDEEEAFRQAEGVPSLDQPFLQKYLDGRDSLVVQEKRQRSDHAFRETMSPMAREASAIVSAIRFEEQQTLWNPHFEDNLAKQEDIQVHPGMMFSLAKDRMESSKLWKIVKKMPKGTLLHCHLGALGDLDWLATEALATEGLCISAKAPMDTPASRQSTVIHFKYVKQSDKTSSPQILWDASYNANTYIPLPTAASSFPGGTDAFITWFKSRASITHEESLQQHLGPNDIWQKFLSTFAILGSLQHYEPIFRKFVRYFLHQLHDDGVRWVELRSVFVEPWTRANQEQPDTDFESMFAALEEEIESFRASPQGQGFWGARLIWTTMRHLPTKGIIEDMKAAIEMKLLFPDLISGYDLVGQEDAGRPLADLTPELFWFKKRCAEAGIDLPFFFHAGETLGDGDTTDENLFDAVLLGTRRIGHGFSLYKHPLLTDMVKEKKILVESCPVSNEILRLTSSVMSHPLPALLARGVPCSLCNDDPAILGQGASGMTHDFWQALQGWENLGLEGLASLAENSVRWACFEDQSARDWRADLKAGAVGKGVKGERMREWAAEFEKFCQWVVLEFGADVEFDTLD